MNKEITVWLDCGGFKKYLKSVRFDGRGGIMYVFDLGNGFGCLVKKDFDSVALGDRWFVTPTRVYTMDTRYGKERNRMVTAMKDFPFVMRDNQVRKFLRSILKKGVSYKCIEESIDIIKTGYAWSDEYPYLETPLVKWSYGTALQHYYNSMVKQSFCNGDDWPKVNLEEMREVK